jgi:hypothetical protein
MCLNAKETTIHTTQKVSSLLPPLQVTRHVTQQTLATRICYVYSIYKRMDENCNFVPHISEEFFFRRILCTDLLCFRVLIWGPFFFGDDFHPQIIYLRIRHIYLPNLIRYINNVYAYRCHPSFW